MQTLWANPAQLLLMIKAEIKSQRAFAQGIWAADHTMQRIPKSMRYVGVSDSQCRMGGNSK